MGWLWTCAHLKVKTNNNKTSSVLIIILYFSTSAYTSLENLKNLKILTISYSILCYCGDVRKLVERIPHVTHLTITRKRYWDQYRIPHDVFLKSIECLEQLKSLESLTLDTVLERESIFVVQSRMTHLRNLYLTNFRFSVSEQQILEYIRVADKLKRLSLIGTKIKCDDSNEFYSKALDMINKRPERISLIIYGWEKAKKPILTSDSLKVLSN